MLKEAAGSADLKVNKSAPLSLNHRIFLNTEMICKIEVFARRPRVDQAVGLCHRKET